MKLMTPILQPDTELIEADAKLIRDSRITDREGYSVTWYVKRKIFHIPYSPA